MTKWVEPDIVAEAAELQAMYGDPAKGLETTRLVATDHSRRADNSYRKYIAARLEMERGESASELLSEVGAHSSSIGFGSAVRSLRLQIRATADIDGQALEADFEDGLRFAEQQQAWFWWKTMQLTRALVANSDALTSHICSLASEDAAYLSWGISTRSRSRSSARRQHSGQNGGAGLSGSCCPTAWRGPPTYVEAPN
jgi:hypothetical protein